VADGPRGGFQLAVRRVRRVFLHARVSIRFVWYFWLLEVCRTVCEVSADNLLHADSSRVGCGQSVIRGAVLVVRVAFLDGPPCPCGRSTLPRGQSAPPRGRFAPGCADCLSPLLLELRYCVVLSWGLFLGLVGPL
jgi:hypothetical protein